MPTETTNKIQTFSFCDAYIPKLIELIKEDYLSKGVPLEKIALVFGGRRPSLFIQEALAKEFKRSFFPPAYFTIDEFIKTILQKTSGVSVPQDLEQSFLIYKLAQKYAPAILKKRESFAQFLPWAREIAEFIDLLDLEMVEEKNLKSIQSNARIGYAVPEDINKLLQHIINLRKNYHKHILESKSFPRGFQYLSAARDVQDVSFDEYEAVLFCNFFYFHKSEEVVIKTFVERNKARLILQGDERKWPVLERIAKHFQSSVYEAEIVPEPKFNLHLYKAYDSQSQAASVREILKNIKEPNETVIVLPDPGQLIPLLTEATQVTSEFNVSMGYPLKRSSLFTMFSHIFKSQLTSKNGRYYTKDYLKTIRHPLIKNLKSSSADSSSARVLVHKIEEVLSGKIRSDISGKLFIDLKEIENCDEAFDSALDLLKRMDEKIRREDLKTLLKTIHRSFFVDWENITDLYSFGQVLENVLSAIAHGRFLEYYPFNITIAREMLQLKDEFLKATFNKEKFEKEEIFRIFENYIGRKLVNFKGSPLKGLQILGLLETRSLNFKNVIVVDVNEGTLPQLKIYEPLIPREVMLSLNLDRLEWEEEIQRYQFMRLISSAKDVYLFFQERKDKEKSRFIEELIWHKEKKEEKILKENALSVGFHIKVASSLKEVKKTPSMIKLLKNHTYSASSLNTYLRDPMEFYYSYVLGLKEKEDLLDEPESRQVGTFIHGLLEESFKPFTGKKFEPSVKFKNDFFKRFDQEFDTKLSKAMRSDAFLIKAVLRERLSRFLENEETSDDRKDVKVLHLEQKFTDVITLPCGEFKFDYRVDRVDELKDGSLLVIDYKTGSMDKLPKPVEELSALNLTRENIYETLGSFQLPLYFYYFTRQFPKRVINAGLYNLRTLDVKKLLKNPDPAQYQDISKVYLKLLDFVLSEILNPDVAFVEGEDRY